MFAQKNLWPHMVALIFALSAGAGDEQQFWSAGDFALVSGDVIKDCRVGYRTFGEANADMTNVLVMPTWFNGTTQHLIDFGHIGPGALLDTNKYFVVAIDSLANGVSCSPSNSKQQPGEKFPALTVLDMVRSQHALLSHLGIRHVEGVIGVSMGGMQALQWAVAYPDFLERAVAIDATPQLSAYGLLQFGNHKNMIRRLQKCGLGNDDIVVILSNHTQLTLYTPDYFQASVGRQGLARHLVSALDYYIGFDADDFVSQIDAITQFSLSDGSVPSMRRLAGRIRARVMMAGNRTDHMVHPAHARNLAHVMDAAYLELDSPCGHLGSTCERENVVAAVHKFLGAEAAAPATR